MVSLAAALASRNPDDTLWMTATHGRISVGAVQALLRDFDPAPWRGKRIALGDLSDVEVAVSLVLLEGVAETVLFLPLEETGEAREVRLAGARIDHVFSASDLSLGERLTKTSSHGTEDRRSIPTRERDTEWLLPTSGTTGTPKLISHRLATLTRHMKAPPPGRAWTWTWGSLYSIRRFAGLQVFFQALTCDAPLILLDSHDDVARVIASLREANCSALSATPSMWRKLAMHPDFEHLRLEQVTLGGEIVDEAVLAVLARCFPAARITHIYASTEAGVGFAVHDRRAGFPAEYLTASPFGVRMRIGEDQHLWLAPPGADSTWLDSGDIVRVQGERVLFLGRANGSINVGGNKVMPEEVEAVIRELPYITFVEVRGRRSPLLGSLVEAAVQPVSGRNVDREMIAEIIAHCRARLEAFKVPAFVVKLDAVELNASGKLSRHSKGQAS